MKIMSIRSVALALVLSLVGSLAVAQIVPLATSPLYSGSSAAPNVAVTLSVEWPTVGMAYHGGTNTPPAYSDTAVYAGYFDSTKCYLYTGGNTASSPGYFYVAVGVTAGASHVCTGSGQFAGNFMNYATMSSVDEFRYAMTGGNRVIETGTTLNGGVIIERAWLPDQSVAQAYKSFYAFDGQSGFPTVRATANALGFSGTPYVNNCRNLVFFGTSSSQGSCDNPNDNLHSNGYLVRVLVCDSNEGPYRVDLCKQYGTATNTYKPVGVVQNNADKVRFAVFSYLLDRTTDDGSYSVPGACYDSGVSKSQPGWNRCRYGGVLRSAMKYVGPTTYGLTGLGTPNPISEINADGSLVANPENYTLTGQSGTSSGFINYINKFGSGAFDQGVYKSWDPMGEMYYEAIRYFQGLQPTLNAVAIRSNTNSNSATTIWPSNLSASVQAQIGGGFPVVTTWTDPIVATCANNYIINLSDTNTNDDVWLPGYANGVPDAGSGSYGPYRSAKRNVQAGEFDALDWTRKVGVLESSTPSLISGDVQPSLAQLDTIATGYQNGSYADVGAAYWANTNPIRPLVSNSKPIKTINFDVNEGPTGSSSTVLQKRALWLMGKYGDFTDSNKDGNPFYIGSAVRSNSEWEDTPGSGTPAGYQQASNPQKLIDNLRQAFALINQTASGTAAGGSITSGSLNYGTAQNAFLSSFNPLRWSGNVVSENVSQVSGVFTVAANINWDASSLLNARCGTAIATATVCQDTDTSINARNIFTTINVGGVRQAASFTYANIVKDANYLAALAKNPATGIIDVPTALTQQRINYLRGYRYDEVSANGFRGRDSPLGDIINSAPTYVGPPSSGNSDTDYQSFFTTNVNRPAVVYVGANDGMLHAFDAVAGTELFAYIPNFVSSYLADLTNPLYVHEPFVDAIPVVREAKVNNVWKTVLVSGAGAGGQGVFALDVTNLTAAPFSPSSVLFEFTDADDADLGNVMFAPEIVKLQTGASTYGYFAAVTGYNNKRPACTSPGNSGLLATLLTSLGLTTLPAACTSNSQGDTAVSATAANTGVLFLLSLDRTLGTPWVRNSNYYKFYFPPANGATAVNGLGPVSALLSKSGSGTASALYFGDLQGDLWRFNTAGLPAAWAPSRGTVGAPQPIFVAKTAASVVQPITARPELGTGPFGSTLVTFGTGEYLGSPDLASYVQQTQYMLIDANGTALIDRSNNLTPRTATLSGGQITVSGNSFLYTNGGSAKGWYLDFPTSGSAGERMINKAALSPNLLAFSSLTLAPSVCGTGGGYVYQVSPVSGLPISSGSGGVGGYVSTVGIPGPPAIVTLAVSNGLTKGTGENIATQTQAVIVSGTNASSGTNTPPLSQVGVTTTGKGPPTSRVSWREITNYNDRH